MFKDHRCLIYFLFIKIWNEIRQLTLAISELNVVSMYVCNKCDIIIRIHALYHDHDKNMYFYLSIVIQRVDRGKMSPAVTWKNHTQTCSRRGDGYLRNTRAEYLWIRVYDIIVRIYLCNSCILSYIILIVFTMHTQRPVMAHGIFWTWIGVFSRRIHRVLTRFVLTRFHRHNAINRMLWSLLTQYTTTATCNRGQLDL